MRDHQHAGKCDAERLAAFPRAFATRRCTAAGRDDTVSNNAPPGANANAGSYRLKGRSPPGVVRGRLRCPRGVLRGSLPARVEALILLRPVQPVNKVTKQFTSRS